MVGALAAGLLVHPPTLWLQSRCFEQSAEGRFPGVKCDLPELEPCHLVPSVFQLAEELGAGGLYQGFFSTARSGGDSGVCEAFEAPCQRNLTHGMKVLLTPSHFGLLVPCSRDPGVHSW